MREAAGFAEAAIGQIVDRLQRPSVFEVERRAGVQHQAGDPLRQVVSV